MPPSAGGRRTGLTPEDETDTLTSHGCVAESNVSGGTRRDPYNRFITSAEVQDLRGDASTAMKPQVTVLTLGVDDLERSLLFYREGLGLTTEGIVGTEFEHGAVVFFPLKGSLMLALYPRKEIAWDAQVSQGPRSSTEFTIGHNVNNKEEVNDVMAQAHRAGARIAKPAGPTFWGGYAGYFHDPDGHLWEVAWNPQLRVEEEP